MNSGVVAGDTGWIMDSSAGDGISLPGYLQGATGFSDQTSGVRIEFVFGLGINDAMVANTLDVAAVPAATVFSFV